MKYTTEFKHISTIKTGDTIKHENIICTVSSNNIKYNSFLGITIFGDSYNLGTKLVEKLTILNNNQ